MDKTGKEEQNNRTESPMKFETAMEQLEKVVACMESGDMDLDSVIAQYEEGLRLAKFCHEKLEQVRKKVEKLNRENQAFRLEVMDVEKNGEVQETEEDEED